MKHTHSWIAAAIAAPVLLSSIQPADDVVFSPGEGSTLTKTFVIDMESTIDDMEIIMNGEEAPNPGIEVTTTVSTSITVTDQYDEVEEGRPLELRRTFDGVSSETALEMENPMIGSQDMESEAETELEGTTVPFGFKPLIKFEDGLRETIDWYLQKVLPKSLPN